MRFEFYSIGQDYFFFDYLSVNVILSSITLFMIDKNRKSVMGYKQRRSQLRELNHDIPLMFSHV